MYEMKYSIYRFNIKAQIDSNSYGLELDIDEVETNMTKFETFNDAKNWMLKDNRQFIEKYDIFWIGSSDWFTTKHDLTTAFCFDLETYRHIVKGLYICEWDWFRELAEYYDSNNTLRNVFNDVRLTRTSAYHYYNHYVRVPQHTLDNFSSKEMIVKSLREVPGIYKHNVERYIDTGNYCYLKIVISCYVSENRNQRSITEIIGIISNLHIINCEKKEGVSNVQFLKEKRKEKKLKKNKTKKESTEDDFYSTSEK